MEETKLIRSVIEFDDLEVGDILIPRVNITAVDVKASPDEVKKIFTSCGYSRIPVYENTIDTIVGVVHEKDFFLNYFGQKHDLRAILNAPVYTTEHLKISSLLKQLGNFFPDQYCHRTGHRSGGNVFPGGSGGSVQCE